MRTRYLARPTRVIYIASVLLAMAMMFCCTSAAEAVTDPENTCQFDVPAGYKSESSLEQHQVVMSNDESAVVVKYVPNPTLQIDTEGIARWKKNMENGDNGRAIVWQNEARFTLDGHPAVRIEYTRNERLVTAVLVSAKGHFWSIIAVSFGTRKYEPQLQTVLKSFRIL